jgi:hypothetical protein
MIGVFWKRESRPIKWQYTLIIAPRNICLYTELLFYIPYSLKRILTTNIQRVHVMETSTRLLIGKISIGLDIYFHRFTTSTSDQHTCVCVCVCVCVYIHVLCFETHNRIIWGQAQLVVHSHSPHAGQAGNFNIISMKRGGRNRFDCTPPRYSASYLSILSEVMRKHTHTHTRRASKFCVSKISRRLRRRIWWAFDDRGHPPVGVRPTQFPCYIYSSSLASVYCIYTCRKKPQQHVRLRAISRNKEVFLARTVFT